MPVAPLGARLDRVAEGVAVHDRGVDHRTRRGNVAEVEQHGHQPAAHLGLAQAQVGVARILGDQLGDHAGGFVVVGRGTAWVALGLAPQAT
jgi:hypothetical protein